jgi:DNA-binding beta-propeller fold protein YncE
MIGSENKTGYIMFRIPRTVMYFLVAASFMQCGSEYEVLLDGGDRSGPGVYWAEVGVGIQRIDIYGRGLKTVVSISPPRVPVDLALYPRTGEVYWAEYTGEAIEPVFRIMRAGLDGTPEALFYQYSTSPNHGPSAIAIDSEAGVIFWNQYQNISGHHDIWQSSLASLAPLKWRNMISNPYLYGYALAVDAANRTIYLSAASYWNTASTFGGGNNGAIFRGDLTIQDTETLLFAATGFANPSVPFRGIAVDGSGGFVFYADATAGIVRIMRADLDVQNPVVWITAVGFEIERIALDKTGQKIYWTSRADSAIYRANLNAPESGVEKFIQLDAVPTAIAILR